MRRMQRETTAKVRDGRVQKKDRHAPTAATRLVVRRARPGPGYRHVITTGDVWRFLDILPGSEELAHGIEQIVLAPGGGSRDGLYESFPREGASAIHLSARCELRLRSAATRSAGSRSLRGAGAVTWASWLLASLVCFAVFGSTARADAVDPPPHSCPRGAIPMASHGGPHCAPAPLCASADDCVRFWGLPQDSRRTCRRSGLCVETRTGYAMDGAFTFSAVVGECVEQADCPTGSRCVVAERCADPLLPVWVMPGSAFVAILAIAGAVLGLSIARRKKRRGA